MSLFEDNAEYAYGYLLGQDSIRNELKDAVKALLDKGVATKACEAYLKDADSRNGPARSATIFSLHLKASPNRKRS